MSKLALSLLLLFSVEAFALETKIAIITSDFDKNVTDYFLETNGKNEITGMHYITTMPNGGIFEDIYLPAERILTEGAVIVERDGRNAVILESENFSLTTGGTLKLNYLYSGVTGTRQIKRLQLVKKSDAFELQDNGKQINRMFLVPNWNRFFGIVGIREIQTSFVSAP